ncbi:MAG: YdcF family protein [Bacteroidetes bacterium]|nr:YdcF family protein [Bacteroidota bacterium]
MSKILAFIISPINWIAFVILFGLIVRNKRMKRRAMVAAIVLFFVFTNGLLVNKCMQLLEVNRIGKSELEEHYDVGILLGGMIHYQSDTNQVNFNSNGDRLFQTIDLYYSGYLDKILISSGSGLLLLPSLKESYLIKQYMVNIGIPEEDILIEVKSKNTHENSVETRKMLELLFSHPEERRYLLITSASHMRRASGCFKKQGLNMTLYSTTKRTDPGPFVFSSEMILPNPQAFDQWKVIGHEVAGLIVYKIEGYI